MAKDDRLKKIKSICDAINKGKWGGENKDACIFLGDKESKLIDRWTSCNNELDNALGGGWPIGRIIEIYGNESSGKSSICYHAIAEFQKRFPEEEVAIVDTEFAFDLTYAKNLGVVTEYLIVHQPESGEQALNVLEQLIESGVKLVIVDSVAGLTPQVEMTGEIGDVQVATQARLMSSGLRRLVSKIGRANATVIFTNQIRDIINKFGFGEKTTTSGGKALKFYSSIRVELKKVGQEKVGEVVISSKIKAVIKKNKTFPPFKVANFIITFGCGIDSVAAILDQAIDKKVIKKSGAWFNFGETRLGQGRQNVIDFLKNNSELLKEIEKACSEIKVVEKDSEDKVLPIPDFMQDDEEETSAEEV